MEVEVPERPPNVPSSAVWAGWIDGGAWIDCSFAFKEPYVGYNCNMFSDNGHPWASGQYVLATVHREGSTIRHEPVGVFARIEPSDYVSFDGVNIHLKNERVLLAHGTIDFPFGDGHGKRAEYALGKEVSPTIQY